MSEIVAYPTPRFLKRQPKYSFPAAVYGLRCYHGVMTWEEAQSRMFAEGIGAYLVRSPKLNNNAADGLVLTVKVLHSCGPHHYPIIERGHGYVLIQEIRTKHGTTTHSSKPFVTIPELLEDLQYHRLACGVRVTYGVARSQWDPWPWQYEYNELLSKGEVYNCYKGKYYNVRGDLSLDAFVKVAEVFEVPALRKATSKLVYEMAVLHDLKPHPNVMKVFALTSMPMTTYVEYCAGGNLSDALKKNGKSMEEFEKQTYLIEAARGMRHLHEKLMVHRTLCAKHCLIAANGTLKLGGFSRSRQIASRPYNKEDDVSNIPHYMKSPEILRSGTLTNFKTDVWAFGALIYEVYNDGVSMFYGENDAAMTTKIVDGKMPTIEKMTKNVKMQKLLATEIWKLEPKERADAQKVLTLLVAALAPMKKENLAEFQINKILGVNRTELPDLDVTLELLKERSCKDTRNRRPEDSVEYYNGFPMMKLKKRTPIKNVSKEEKSKKGKSKMGSVSKEEKSKKGKSKMGSVSIEDKSKTTSTEAKSSICTATMSQMNTLSREEVTKAAANMEKSKMASTESKMSKMSKVVPAKK